MTAEVLRTTELNGGTPTALVVAERTRAADGVAMLRLARPDGSALPDWTAGAHIDVVMPEGLERQYSLCGPHDGNWYIAVLNEPDSRGGSRWLHAHAQQGSELTIRGPRNRFALVTADRYLLIAGGIGITPLIAMVRELEAQGRDWTLAYGGRSRSSMAFLDELEALGERVTVVPQDTDGLLDLDTLLGSPAIGTAVYCCGPEPLLAEVERRCRSWPPGALHVERFAAAEVDASGDREFEVVAVRSGITATVEVGDTILQVLEDQGVSLPTSCGEGVCGTCETRVLEGEVDHRDAVLTEQEQETNTVMMVCCSRAKGDRLVLDV